MTDTLSFRDALARQLGKGHAKFKAICDALEEAGGRCVVVGGWVRDLLLQRSSPDVDVEIFGLPQNDVERIIRRHIAVDLTGKKFSVFTPRGLNVQFSLPRLEKKTAPGHGGFTVTPDPWSSFEKAARRRDLTINAIGIEWHSGALLDPFAGRQDLRRRRLRAVDPVTFPDDPLRTYRVMQFAGRFSFTVDPSLLLLCREMSPEDIAPERIWGEWKKLLLDGQQPSLGLEFLADCRWLEYFPPLQQLAGTPQNPQFHQGDVWTHTLRALDEAAGLRINSEPKDLLLMLGILCHDLGKPAATRWREDRWTAYGHCKSGIEPCRQLIESVGLPHKYRKGIEKIVLYHMRPVAFTAQGAKPKAFRKLAALLHPELDCQLLGRVALADDYGKGKKGDRPPAWYLLWQQKISMLNIATRPIAMVLQGRHLVACGLQPGRQFGVLLDAAYERQLETDTQDPQELLDWLAGDPRFRNIFRVDSS